MKKEFLCIAEALNKKLNIVPLLFGSLGLEQRLHTNLDADDIDILIPEVFLHEKWDSIVAVMNNTGYVLYDLHTENTDGCFSDIKFERDNCKISSEVESDEKSGRNDREID